MSTIRLVQSVDVVCHRSKQISAVIVGQFFDGLADSALHTVEQSDFRVVSVRVPETVDFHLYPLAEMLSRDALRELCGTTSLELGSRTHRLS